MALEVLYIHVPFCKRRCRYCDFASSACKVGDVRAYSYAQKVLQYLEAFGAAGFLESCSTGYVGGGTPTMLGPEVLSGLLAAAGKYAQLRELSFEANPDSLDAKMLKSAKAAGATRVSMGVQSFVDLELKALGRVHSAQQAKRALKLAQKSELNVSIDLMCGIPYQNLESLNYSLKEAMDAGVEHISIYPLMIEEGTAMERLCEAGELPWPDDDAQADYMEAAERSLDTSGLSRYEVASYAKPGKACAHNIAYWSGKEYLGLGWSGASMVGRDTYAALKRLLPQLPVLKSSTQRIRFTCASDIDEIIAAPGADVLRFDVEELTQREAIAEDLMLAARMSAGISLGLYTRAHEVLGATLDATLDNLLKRDLLRFDGSSWAPSHKGWLLGNELYGELWGLAS